MTRKLTISISTYSHVSALRDGTVKIEGVDPEFVDGPSILPAARAMCRTLDYDVVEMPITTYMVARSVGKPLIALPVFPARSMPLMYMFRRSDLVDEPAHLAGARIGVRAYTVTTAVWARGILADRYGLDPNDVTWVTGDEEHVLEFRHPANVEHRHGTPLVDMLESGDVAAVLGDNIDIAAHPRIDFLIPSPVTAATNWLDDGHPYPQNHAIVVRQELADREPEVVQALFDAFEEARVRALDDPSEMITPASNPSPLDRQFALSQFERHPMQYGLGANRAALTTLVGYARDQHILDAGATVDDFFLDISSS